ncbi:MULTISPECIES: DoxX family protein [Rummeliibacillus]|uniref:DoxX family protein n=1 Tax=Rummeliibacillus TaxID=648802 RepID=UPI0011B78AA3|nr:MULTISPECIES: DoxX family protein [Rummeliibacillus]MBO2536795.1 DoxX family protein [Rummeliibacillus suwonensis]
MILIQLLLSLAFMYFGYLKLTSHPMPVANFTEVYGYGKTIMYGIGAIEVTSAIGLLIGFFKKGFLPISSGALAVVMVGAITTHLKIGEGFEVALKPFIFFVLSVIIFLVSTSDSVED